MNLSNTRFGEFYQTLSTSSISYLPELGTSQLKLVFVVTVAIVVAVAVVIVFNLRTPGGYSSVCVVVLVLCKVIFMSNSCFVVVTKYIDFYLEYFSCSLLLAKTLFE